MHLQFLGDRKLKMQSGINRLIQIGGNNSSEVFVGMCNSLYFFHYKYKVRYTFWIVEVRCQIIFSKSYIFPY